MQASKHRIKCSVCHKTLDIECSFCHKAFKQGEPHDCPNKLYSVLNSISRIQKDPDHLFNDVDNMVFQGGGIKGLGYVGVMDQLIHHENADVFKNLKRVGGNSAGAIFSLYVALNLDYEDVFYLVGEKPDYQKLLDDGIALRVATNIINISHKNFTVVDVLYTAKDKIVDIVTEIEKKPSDKAAQNKLKDFVKNMLKYFITKVGLKMKAVLFLFSGAIAKAATEWIISLLSSGKNSAKMKPAFKFGAHQPAAAPVNQTELEKTISAIIDEVYSSAEKDITDAMNKVSEKEAAAEEEAIQFYLDQALQQQPNSDISPKSELVGYLIDYALSELLWFVLISHTDYKGAQRVLGLFTGNKIKRELLEGAIKLKFDRLGRPKEYKEGFTFKELDEFKDENGKKLFKPFYVAAYNASNQITEIFSVEHSPNAVAVDAVRASMAIPVFFQAVTIIENGAPRKVYYEDKDGKEQSEDVYYFDGGVLDNYPLYIFDDLKYCLEDIPEWLPEKKVVVQNPKTIGFRLLDPDLISIYEKPYLDADQTKRKRIGTQNYANSFLYIAATLFGALYENGGESEFLKYGNCPRSVFISDLKMSAEAFDLTPEQKAALMQAGRDGVNGDKKRAKTNFIGEGEKYFSEVPDSLDFVIIK